MTRKRHASGVRKRRKPQQTRGVEVADLKKELARARARIASLEAGLDEDPLTGLLNRRGFGRELWRALAFVRRYGATGALLYLDLDHFKSVNDRYGHAVGDVMLAKVAKMIAQNVRASDMVGRIGGDEFVVLMWNVRDIDAEARARSLEQLVVGTSFAHKGKSFKLGLSTGVALLRQDDTVESAIARADNAMYARKRARAR